MPQLVTGLYAAPNVADSAVAALKQHGFEAAAIFHLRPGAEQTPALADAGLSPRDAAAVAAEMGSSNSLVGVRPPFGHAGRAMQIMQSYQGTNLRSWLVREERRNRRPGEAPALGHASFHDGHGDYGWSNAAPFSRLLNWRVLANDFFFSALLGWRMLTNAGSASPLTGNVQGISNDAAPFSRLLGLPTLSRDPAPLSSTVHARTLS